MAVERQRQRRHADRQQDKAAEIEAAGLHLVVGHQQQRGDGAHDAHRNIDQENPVPTGVLHQETAQRRPHQRADLAWQRHESHRRHVLLARHDLHHRQAPDRHHHRAADALNHARGDQLVQGFRAGAEEGAEGKQHDGAEKHPLYADLVRQPAAGRQRHCHRQHIGDDHRLHAQRVLPQAGGHRGQGGVDDSGIQRLHKEAECHYPELPAYRGGVFHQHRSAINGAAGPVACCGGTSPAAGRSKGRPPGWCTASAVGSSPGRRRW